jgi:hypothetical protein
MAEKSEKVFYKGELVTFEEFLEKAKIEKYGPTVEQARKDFAKRFLAKLQKEGGAMDSAKFTKLAEEVKAEMKLKVIPKGFYKWFENESGFVKKTKLGRNYIWVMTAKGLEFIGAPVPAVPAKPAPAKSEEVEELV